MLKTIVEFSKDVTSRLSTVVASPELVRVIDYPDKNVDIFIEYYCDPAAAIPHQQVKQTIEEAVRQWMKERLTLLQIDEGRESATVMIRMSVSAADPMTCLILDEDSQFVEEDHPDVDMYAVEAPGGPKKRKNVKSYNDQELPEPLFVDSDREEEKNEKPLPYWFIIFSVLYLFVMLPTRVLVSTTKWISSFLFRKSYLVAVVAFNVILMLAKITTASVFLYEAMRYTGFIPPTFDLAQSVSRAIPL